MQDITPVERPASQATRGKPSIVIAATFTIEPILPPLRYALKEAALSFDVQVAAYNQVFQELFAATSVLGANANGVNIIIARIEDFVREITEVAEARLLIERTVDQLLDALAAHARHAKAPTVLALLSPSRGARQELVATLESATNNLTARARALPGITLLSQTEIDFVSAADNYDAISDALAHIPYTEEYYASLALAIARKVHALCVPASKVLVLDCDNTLWRGVVGEDGVDGITIPPALAYLQRFAVEEQARGVLLCLASKNAERDVLEVFEKRSDMILKKAHIVAHRIDWNPKPENIRSLARLLNLGLDSFVYLDDNPVECELMRAELPEVVTLQVPSDGEVESFLNNIWVFDKTAITDEDAQRTKMYRENAARQELEKSTTDIAQFIASLNVVVDIDHPEEREWARVAQLTQRTNQFNFTTIRRTEAEMRGLSGQDVSILRVKVRDRFGDYGLVGVVITDEDGDTLLVDTLLLSCRVLGRGVEHAIIRRLGEIATASGLSYVNLPFVQTSKNEPARAFAESVATQFRQVTGDRVNYRIPADAACRVSHRPGHDPAAVIDALRSEENKASASSKANTGTAGDDRSRRYTNLARNLISGRDVLRIARSGSLKARSLPGEPQKPATETEAQLLRLWEEILGFDQLGVEDDYFALGGTSLLSVKLFAEINRRFGFRLPLTTILEAPTVRALALRFASTSMESSRNLIELKSGGPRNLFLVHDGDGETLLYLNWAIRMPADVTVYGIKPHRLTRIPLGHARIEDMAAFYIQQMRKKQPQGPFYVGGMCAGGVIAYEIAAQLVRAGEKVDLAMLLDAATPQAQKRRGRIAKQRLQRLANTMADAQSSGSSRVTRAFLIVSAILRRAVTALTWEIKQRGIQWWTRARFNLLQQRLARRRPWPRLLPELTFRQIYDTAERSYTPQLLGDTAVVLVRARAGEGGDTPYREIYTDETLGWGKVASNLAVLDVDGGHSSMLQEPFVDSLSEALNGWLDKTKNAQFPSLESTKPKQRRADIKNFAPQA